MSSGGGGGEGGSAARYERQEQIGSGTFGHAWLVRSRASGRHYVVKEIKVSALPEQEREQSVNEVAILSQCKHVNIIRYKEAFIEQLTGSLNIVMEYADGGDLYARIVNQRATNDHFPEELILNWFIQITFAVQYLHSKNILHRDLKTQNIFLTSENLVKVGDFGIARTLRSTQELATTAIGTPYYLSPEICQRQPYNHKSDQWAVGCIVYEMCCLTHPFNASSFENLVLKILQARYSPIPSHYSLLLRDLVTVLLRTQPERRPSAEQVLMIPALKPFVDTYVEWQNAALSPRGSRRATVDSAQGSSNGSDDRDSLASSQEDIFVSSMTADSLETAVTRDTPAVASDSPPSPGPASAAASAAAAAPHPWRSQYANQLESAADCPAREQISPPAAAPSVARRRSEDAGSPLDDVPAALAPRPRSSSLSSLSPEDRKSALYEERVHSPLVPGTSGAKLKGRSQVSRGPSALIRQVLKNKFSRQESVRPRIAGDPESVRARSASDPADPSDAADSRSHPPRDRSPARVFRRPSLSVARVGTARSPQPHSSGGRSRSPVPQSRSPGTTGSSRTSPPLNRRNARFLDAPTPRSSGAAIARPVERRPVPRSGSTISATSNMSTNGNTATREQHPSHAGGVAASGWAESSVQGDGTTPDHSEAGAHDGSAAGDTTSCKQQQQQQQQQQQLRSDSSVSNTSGREGPADYQQRSTEIQQQQSSVLSKRGGSPASVAERTSREQLEETEETGDTDSDSQEATLVGLPVSRHPDINHNNIQIAGGQLHTRSGECAGGTCCSLICAQCRYTKDEQLARVMWSSRLRARAPADDAVLLQHLSKILGAERLSAVLGRLLDGWESGDAAWSDELLLALGRQQLHLLPLLVQAVQLKVVSGRPAASPSRSGHRSPNTR